MSVNLVVCHCDTFSNKQFNMKPKVYFYLLPATYPKRIPIEQTEEIEQTSHFDCMDNRGKTRRK